MGLTVTVKATTTVWADANGSPIPNPEPINSEASPSILQKNLGIGLGVGLGVPFIAAVAFSIWFFRCRKRSTGQKQGMGQADTGQPTLEKQAVHPSSPEPLYQKLELDGMGVQPFPTIHPSVITSRVVVQELPGPERTPELSSPPNQREVHHPVISVQR
jgi:hypothetical protein